MASCLGLYIEENLIKYAKVTRDKDTLKVDAFGVKFYDKIGPAIQQIISETYSFKIPISINLSNETYQYFYFFNLLNKKDLKKSIETEFDSYCFDKGYNKNALDSRYALVQDLQDKDKIKTVYIFANKAEINKKIQEFGSNKLSYILPLPMCIANIMEIKKDENTAIVNLESKTTITTVINEKIYDVTKIDDSMEIILNSISEKENSYSKAYEICKNTTIYTMETQELQQEGNLYLEDIMPTLYNIVKQVKEYIDNSINKIDKVYLTGTGCIINNVDLYFQEYLGNVKCEILKPNFVTDNLKINMKDYIEVNSAIALAMQGLGYGIKSINFKKKSFADSLPEWMQITTGTNKNGFKTIDLSTDWKAKFDGTEKMLTRLIIMVMLAVIAYSAGTIYIDNEVQGKLSEIEDTKAYTDQQISLASADIQKLNNRTSDYEQWSSNLKQYSEVAENNLKTKNIIPLLLTRIMNVIPKGVTLTSIENTGNSHITINAKSSRYELLGIFKASIMTEGILSPSTVTSTSGVQQGGEISTTIEGDLP